MKNIRIEEVGDINSVYPYLEVFYLNGGSPFCEISISEEKQLVFKLYADEAHLTLEEWEHMSYVAKEFLPKAIKNEDDFLHF